MEIMTGKWKQNCDGGYGKTPLAVWVGQGVAVMHGRYRGPEVVTGQLLTRTNHEPPVHFQTLEKGYPEDGTITVIIDTDTNLNGRSGAQKGE